LKRGINLKKEYLSYIFFITGIIDIIISIINFSENNTSFGVTYLALALAAMALGVHFRKKYN
jgi:hypothetical protein